jgi:hypothetical protein
MFVLAMDANYVTPPVATPACLGRNICSFK